MPAFPLKAGAHNAKNDVPPSDKQTVGIFDARGYWASFGFGSFELPATVKNIDRMDMIVRMMNAAYYQGRSDQRKDVREALGIGEDDD